jgi:hypothetical protein
MLEFQRCWNGRSAGTNGNAGSAAVAGIIVVENSISKAGDLMNPSLLWTWLHRLPR